MRVALRFLIRICCNDIRTAVFVCQPDEHLRRARAQFALTQAFVFHPTHRGYECGLLLMTAVDLTRAALINFFIEGLMCRLQ